MQISYITFFDGYLKQDIVIYHINVKHDMAIF